MRIPHYRHYKAVRFDSGTITREGFIYNAIREQYSDPSDFMPSYRLAKTGALLMGNVSHEPKSKEDSNVVLISNEMAPGIAFTLAYFIVNYHAEIIFSHSL